MSLISSVISNRKKGRPKLILIFLFWFEEYVISLYNEFKLEKRSVTIILCYHYICFHYPLCGFYKGLWFTKAAILYGFMILGLFCAPSKKEVDSRNRMGVSVWSTFQKVERIHEIEYFIFFFYAYFQRSCYFLKFQQSYGPSNEGS